MAPRLTALTIALTTLAPVVAAQTAPDPTADRATIMRKAAADPALKRLLSGYLGQSSSETTRERADKMMRYSGYIDRGGLTRPMNIAAPQQLRVAQVRAQAASQILIADLNGDWQVSTDEIRAALSVRKISGPAAAMLTYDANADGVLDLEEIKQAAATAAARTSPDRPNPLVLFDFDNDGILTPEEYRRGLDALGT